VTKAAAPGTVNRFDARANTDNDSGQSVLIPYISYGSIGTGLKLGFKSVQQTMNSRFVIGPGNVRPRYLDPDAGAACRSST
jgi:hypothetical protein